MDDKQVCKRNSVDDQGSNTVLYPAHTRDGQGSSKINTLNAAINIGKNTYETSQG